MVAVPAIAACEVWTIKMRTLSYSSPANSPLLLLLMLNTSCVYDCFVLSHFVLADTRPSFHQKIVIVYDVVLLQRVVEVSWVSWYWEPALHKPTLFRCQEKWRIFQTLIVGQRFDVFTWEYIFLCYKKAFNWRETDRVIILDLWIFIISRVFENFSWQIWPEALIVRVRFITSSVQTFKLVWNRKFLAW
jgi:hypothetical protein